MIINASSLKDVFTGFKTSFQEGFKNSTTHHRTLAMVIPSSAHSERYGWLGKLPKLREWIGDRHVHGLAVHDYEIRNRKFELTISVPRTDIEDDRFGVYAPMLREMGQNAAEHPDELIYELIKSGFTKLCYDGQYFFDTDHPVNSGASQQISVSNLARLDPPPADPSTIKPWYLLDLSRTVKPFVWQERIAYDFTRLDNDSDENVFWRDQYTYGVRARANAGFGLWQLAYASELPLTAENYKAARVAMQSMIGDDDHKLRIRPTHLVVPPSLEADAMQLLNTENDAAGASNIWKGTAELIISPWLD